jgi:hypothetical protein
MHNSGSGALTLNMLSRTFEAFEPARAVRGFCAQKNTHSKAVNKRHSKEIGPEKPHS